MPHPLLERQLKRLGLGADAPPALADWQKLLDRIDRAYAEADQDRYLLERSLTISSQEMQDLTRQLQEQLADLSVLNEVSQGILQAEAEEELLAAIHEQVSRVMDTSNFYVALYDPARQEVDFSYDLEDGQLSAQPQRFNISQGGLTVHIIQTRQALFLPDKIDARLAEMGIVGQGRSALSYMGVPLIAGEQTIGVIAVQSYRQEHAYSSRHLALLTNIAAQAALAIQRLRLRNSEQRKTQQLRTISEVARQVTAILDLDTLLRELTRSIQIGFGYSTVAVLDADVANEELVLGAITGRYAGIADWGYRQSLGEGLAGWAATKKRSVYCNNVAEEARFVRGFDAEEQTQSEMCVPILYANQVMGVLDIQSDELNAFDQADVEALEMLASQLAAAMHNAVLFRQRGEQLTNVNALNRVAEAASSATNLDELLTTLGDVIVDLFHPDGLQIVLRDPVGGGVTAPLAMVEGRLERNVPLAVEGLLERLLTEGNPLLIQDLGKEAAGYAVAQHVLPSGRPVASWLGVPLRAATGVIGGIVVQSWRPHALDEVNLTFLQTVAGQVAAGIERVRLFEEMQNTLDELRWAGEQQRRLFEMVREMSTPLVPISRGVLLLPLVGTIDSERAQQILNVLLAGIMERRARVVILDITGVPVVDTSVANYLLQATRSTQLLGSECILVGITPEVAQTVVGLGVDLRGVVTRSDLQSGIEHALRLIGQRIVGPARRPASAS